MFAPVSAIRPAIAATAAGRSGMPSTVTWLTPPGRSRLSPVPRSTSTCMSRSAATRSTADRSAFQSRGTVTRTPRTSRRRSTICSMSRTWTPKAASVENIIEVTPGRSLPVTVISRVFGASSMALRGYRRPHAMSVAVSYGGP